MARLAVLLLLVAVIAAGTAKRRTVNKNVLRAVLQANPKVQALLRAAVMMNQAEQQQNVGDIIEGVAGQIPVVGPVVNVGGTIASALGLPW